MKEKSFYLTILFYTEDNEKTAHCLEFDIVTVGKNYEEANFELMKLINAHVNFAIENDNEEFLYKPAPAQYWNMLRQSNPIKPTENNDNEVINEKGFIKADNKTYNINTFQLAS